MTTSAAAQVFAVPELVERILEHASPASLYGLRRGNPTSNGIIQLKKFHHRMLIAPLGRLSIMRLVRVVRSPQIQRAIAPFSIVSVHPANSGREVTIHVHVAGRWIEAQYDSLYQRNISRDSPCQRTESWRQIKVDAGGKALTVRLGKSRGGRQPGLGDTVGVLQWQSGDEVTLGGLMDECIKTVQGRRLARATCYGELLQNRMQRWSSAMSPEAPRARLRVALSCSPITASGKCVVTER
ncbi:hypothetical protein DOTSEDRAFT_36687 [Dothistroma septosporum NZE10]|uniref:Uncharacterized protein n=1 Tax=Dothistroma septosporum (strain NZE10 / CBS 128990) TaxID=675120 RepID=N1PF78_DOTSN|nr:hypothetical protein DOTSEDRAFT_36687 [Dothistroma septosporum NZE10]